MENEPIRKSRAIKLYNAGKNPISPTRYLFLKELQNDSETRF